MDWQNIYSIIDVLHLFEIDVAISYNHQLGWHILVNDKDYWDAIPLDEVEAKMRRCFESVLTEKWFPLGV